MKDYIAEIENAQKKEQLPEFGVGDTVKVSAKIIEGTRERIQVFEGTGLRKTFTVRKLASGVGVEKTWPLHSPNVADVKVVRYGKVRRAKLFYLRERTGKATRV